MVLGEPQLGKRNMYPNKSQLYEYQHPAKTTMDIIAYCDSKHTLFDISKKLNIKLSLLIKVINELKDHNLISAKHIR